MVKDIEKLLAEGATPESLYQEALRIVEAKNAAAEKMKQEKKNKREAVIDAVIDYVELITGEKADEAMREEFAAGLSEFEGVITELARSTANVKTEPKRSTDDDKLREFLRGIGAM